MSIEVTKAYIQSLIDYGASSNNGQGHIVRNYVSRAPSQILNDLIQILTEVDWTAGTQKCLSISHNHYKDWLLYWIKIIEPIASSRRVKSQLVTDFITRRLDEMAVICNQCAGCKGDDCICKELPDVLNDYLVKCLNDEHAKYISACIINYYGKIWSADFEKYMLIPEDSTNLTQIRVSAQWHHLIKELGPIGRDRANIDLYKTYFQTLDDGKLIFEIVNKALETDVFGGDIIYKSPDTLRTAIQALTSDVLELKPRQRKTMNGSELISVKGTLDLFLRVSNTWSTCRHLLTAKPELEMGLTDKDPYTRELAKALYLQSEEKSNASVSGCSDFCI